MSTEATPETGAFTVLEAVDNWYKDAPAEEAEATPELASEETPDVDPVESTEEDTVEPEETEDADEAEPESDSDEPQLLNLDEYGDLRVPVKVNGEERIITLAEAAKGYQLEADYRKKTSSLAEERRALEAQTAQWEEQFNRQQQQYAELLEQVVGKPPDPSLAEDDPYEYNRLRAKWDAKQAEVQQARQEAERRQAETMHRRSVQEAQALAEKAPEFHDAKFVEGLVSGLSEAYGFDPREIAATADHRMFLLAKDAMAYRAAKKGNAKVEKALAKPAKVIKPGAAKTSSEREAGERAAIRKKLSKPHSIQEHLKALGLD